ncbi:glycosyltransferase [Luteolibacter sp. GHJ8]|uniref:Glycosyltransferase n=1 Tax=Luteolibacter rhizosphaerae TaxID=2989719 RepID=A0ABT3FZC9_9BACT|nr:glycosyltransferase [Luteolibacter rhizosphaerae]MCW1912951.1 glycosyltransferase [Luteolibacter rhizosphaerae]
MNPINLPVQNTRLLISPRLNRKASAILRSPDDDEKSGGNKVESLPIIAICHLSWDWVWQRPQQFLSRMAKTHPVLFVELHCSPVSQGVTHLRTWEENHAVRILQIHLPQDRWHDGEYIDRERLRLLLEAMRIDLAGQFSDAILWINDPMAAPAYVGNLGEAMVVYDCMDELTQFAGAPAGLAEREARLVQQADVIFCGGQKMRTKRLPGNSNTHFYGTGVDCDHFAAALKPAPAHPDLKQLGGPVLGYFGVVDERIDYPLLAFLADHNPHWQIAMVGPFAKVDVAALPSRPNLHWLGPKPYQELPSLCRQMDVCLMPFALNEATEFINPTKALEYMAAGRPVVSTALDEVRSNFAVAARIASGPAEFARFCEEEITRPSAARVLKGLQLAQANTWERLVENMNNHIQEVVDSRGPQGIASRRAPSSNVATGIAPSYV